MRRIVLFIASSLDGYIARPSGEVDWLFTDQDYGYTDFLAEVDTVLMGRKTYEQVLTFGEFPYQEKQCFVFSQNPDFDASPHAKTVGTDVKDFVQGLRQSEGKTIWLVGGAALIHPFIAHRLLDEIILFVHPILLGGGIPLFAGETPTQALKLVGHHSYDSGLLRIIYQAKS
ncbi:dihydrofolate reductase family protein [Kovacikia minuta CCNUW1]|uniref:dihydrofolate reductase family protein n=1 Tax=Kovacikia minuta TaxID=2931930 RepID=UPI001CCA28F6|nr:dihydrofolate reductase family protein [Kovacikia minuta]UBF26246.1 dihydrofolate reductase family protein [Kovacikia minuta CCNUW1]